MFDWWERLFDYTAARADVRRRGGRPLWHLFEEAQEKQPAHPGYLLRHMAADARHWQLDLRYFQGQNVPVYEVTSADLADERWTLRAWHADRWLRAMQGRFAARDIEAARPDLWASDDPSAALPGENQTGNANLLAFVTDGCLENGEPRRYDDLQRLNDGLRDRGRRRADRLPVPQEPRGAALAARDSSPPRPATSATCSCSTSRPACAKRPAGSRRPSPRHNSYVRRARLGLEPGWTITRDFARLWDREFATFRIWQACKRRRALQGELDRMGRAGEGARHRGVPFPRPTGCGTRSSPSPCPAGSNGGRTSGRARMTAFPCCSRQRLRACDGYPRHARG